MSPLDDELRTALTSRTSTLSTGPDFFAGVERRAQRMRRQRVAGGIAGSVLAVGALGLGGPLVASSLTGTAPSPIDRATGGPSPAPAVDRFVLDPAAPWAYRGAPLEQLGQGTVEAVRVQYAAQRGVPVDDVALSPLYGQVGAVPGDAELFFLAQVAGAASWGVARSSESGPEILQDQPLAPRTTALPAALPGEAVSRLVVVAAEATDVQYCRGGLATCESMGAGDGLGQTVLDGDTSGDAFRVLAPDGRVVAEGPAPDGDRFEGEGRGPAVPPGDEVPVPLNAVDWPTVGGASPELVEAALTHYAVRVEGVSREQVGGRLLYGYEPQDREQGYLLLQVWAGGDARAFGVSYEQRSGLITSGVLSGSFGPGPAVLAVLFPGGATGAVQQLLVLPEPRAGQVRYSPDGTSEPAAVPDQGTGAAVVIPRAGDARGDRLLVLDREGDPDRPVLRGTVEDLLASMR